ncbi:hypothetical protein [Serratia fonticola]|uniref:hypothetical protein n=1 Tax=Serratia fonticola TaxID=47917 RepID=UPI0021AD9751|nr:hypothetical protein [Serratia fonticola]
MTIFALIFGYKKTGQRPVVTTKNYHTDNKGNNENNDDSGVIIAPGIAAVFGTTCLLFATFVLLSLFL